MSSRERKIAFVDALLVNLESFSVLLRSEDHEPTKKHYQEKIDGFRKKLQRYRRLLGPIPSLFSKGPSGEKLATVRREAQFLENDYTYSSEQMQRRLDTLAADVRQSMDNYASRGSASSPVFARPESQSSVYFTDEARSWNLPAQGHERGPHPSTFHQPYAANTVHGPSHGGLPYPQIGVPSHYSYGLSVPAHSSNYSDSSPINADIPARNPGSSSNSPHNFLSFLSVAPRMWGHPSNSARNPPNSFRNYPTFSPVSGDTANPMNTSRINHGAFQSSYNVHTPPDAAYNQYPHQYAQEGGHHNLWQATRSAHDLGYSQATSSGNEAQFPVGRHIIPWSQFNSEIDDNADQSAD
ncbi:hypothetical protein BDZ97DRAFT_1926923 [Flammula alnicola]|nr:hypothetical protein BDZ97DRAFT_1926923 [Flammula alnicola]